MNEFNLKDRLIELISNMSEDRQKDLLSFLERQQGEYRRYPRRPCSIITDYEIQNKAYKDFIKNISAGGVYINTKQKQAVGQGVTLTFMLDGHYKPITVTGKIVRVSAQGFAVKFYREIQEYFIELENNIKSEI